MFIGVIRSIFAGSVITVLWWVTGENKLSSQMMEDVFRTIPLVSSDNFQYLFKTLPSELENFEIALGSTNIPSWLDGVWVKTGFCVFGNNRYKPKMLFDASGCGYQFVFNKGNNSIKISAKRLQSKYHSAFVEGRYPLWRTFEEFDPERRGLDRLLTLVSQDQADNYLVNLVSLGNNRIAALTDLAGELELDPDTMNTKGLVKWNDDLEKDNWNMISSAHPSRVGSKHGKLYNYLLNMNIPLNMLTTGKPFVYKVIEIDLEKQRRRIIAEIPTNRHHYVHENAVTEDYFTIIEFPYIWSLFKIVTNTAIKNALEFIPALGIRFKVVNIKTGTLQREFHLPSESFYAFHQINAYQERDKKRLVLTMTAYDDIAYHLGHSFSLFGGHLNNTFDLPPATIRRVILDLDTGHVMVQKLGIVDMELPMVSDTLRGQQLRYVYAHAKSVSSRANNCKAGPGCGGTWWDFITKVDLEQDGKEVARWRRSDFWPSEPVFVPRPQGLTEDDGVLLNVLLGDGQKSYLLILDARNFTELGLLTLPIHLPYQSHGSWYSHS
jgi:beta,beta-carotene 9',10'-dioxygenase